MSPETRTAPARPYERKMPSDWWLKNPRYFIYMIRELSCVAVAIFVIMHLLHFLQMGAGAGGAAKALETARSPWIIGLNVVLLLFVLVHTVTWLGLTGKIQVVRLGDNVVSPKLVSAGAFAGWIVATAVIAGFLILWGG